VPDAAPDAELRDLIPRVLATLVRRGADFATAEDAVQEASIRAVQTWDDAPPDDPEAWMVTVAWRAFIDLTRSEGARRDRETRVAVDPPAGPAPSTDDTLELYFLCAHPQLTASSAVALTLRAVGGLTTRQIAEAYVVPEATMAQRISRAKRTVADAGLDQPGDLAIVMKVLYLVFNEGYAGDVDLAAEAIRLVRRLVALEPDAEVRGLLALMLLHHARSPSRTRPGGGIVPLARPLSELDRRRMYMLDAQLEHRGVLRAAEQTVAYLASRPAIVGELDELREVLDDRVAVPVRTVPVPEWPLALHRHYSRREIAAAVGHVTAGEKKISLQGGILQLKDQQRELLFVTLDKSGKGFSPTTRYRDYAISPTRFHWETQGAASVASRSGRRYLESATNGWSFFLFVRTDPGAQFAFLGPVRYESHTGDRPIAITWRLEWPMPAALHERYATLRQG
jgi:RNA polymerase sigma factor (sigma-70 family)